MDEITDLLSEKRLAKYKEIAKEDAFKCHLFNSELAESFYSSLSYFEIILRNFGFILLSPCIFSVYYKEYDSNDVQKYFKEELNGSAINIQYQTL